MNVLADSPGTSEAERRGESGDGPQSEGGEGEEEAEQDGRLRFRGDHPDRTGREQDTLGREAAQDAAQGDEEEDAERGERQRGRLQFDPRQECGGRESARDGG